MPWNLSSACSHCSRTRRSPGISRVPMRPFALTTDLGRGSGHRVGRQWRGERPHPERRPAERPRHRPGDRHHDDGEDVDHPVGVEGVLQVDGRTYITGTPGRRDWYANLLANPDFIFHFTHSTQADLPARALTVVEPAEHARVIDAIRAKLGAHITLDATSPLVEVTFPAQAA